MFSTLSNTIWSNFHSQQVINNNNTFISHPSTITHRIIFLLSTIVLFWTCFVIIYFLSRVIIRLVSLLKRYYFNRSLTSTKNVCQAFVISSNQYGSFQAKHTLHRTDSFFSNNYLIVSHEPMPNKSNYDTIKLTMNQYSNILENRQYQHSKANLLEHYLKTYNPLQIDLSNSSQETITTSEIRITAAEEIPSETDTQPLDNCYSLQCANKHRLHRKGRYVRLKESEHSATLTSVAEDHLSECSTKLTTTTLPIVMVTDCSDSQRLHTDIIELNDEE
ncbi:unnamed protein product [Adineta ricciae]|uniref:Uncharacterized protein n=1 Tax=Adineta ricciae TaxID=249248 RepID=A0A814FIX3_ADIRI|nr:unnamed protein product [Adineta ricciae]